ncbi:MAG: DMT family transporter [Pseudomonadota bacterium]
MISRLAKYLNDNAYLLLLLTTLFWAGNFVLGRGIAGHIPPIALSWFRWVFAFAILLPFTLPYLRKDWPVIKQNIPILTFLGVLGVGSFNTLAYIGLNDTTAINALILQTSGPALIMIGAFATFGERVSYIQFIGLLIALPGVLIIILKGELTVLSQMSLNTGDIWIFVAMVSWTIYTILLRFRPQIHAFSLASVTFGIGALFVTPFFLGEMLYGHVITFDTTTLLSVAYVAIFPSTLAYIFYNRGVELIGPNQAGAFLYIVPLFGAVLAILLLGETLQTYHLWGFLIIFIGVWMISHHKNKV